MGENPELMAVQRYRSTRSAAANAHLRQMMARRNAYASYAYSGGNYMRSPSASAYGRYRYGGGSYDQRNPQVQSLYTTFQSYGSVGQKYPAWSRYTQPGQHPGQAGYVDPQAQAQANQGYAGTVVGAVPERRSPAYGHALRQRMKMQQRMQPWDIYIEGELPPPPMPEEQVYGGGYGGGYLPYYGGGGGGGGGWSGGGGGSYLPGAYSPFQYGQGVEQQQPQYGSGMNLSLWNI